MIVSIVLVQWDVTKKVHAGCTVTQLIQLCVNEVYFKSVIEFVFALFF